jgi:glycosyltransferase involved in cell wall biosynthesis
MKLLLVISALSQGGAERVLAELANRWSAKHDIAVLTIKGRDSDFFSLDPSVRRYSLGVKRARWWRPLPHLRILAGIRGIVATERPDFVVTFVVKTNLFTLAACLGTGAKVIACEHSVIGFEGVDAKQRWIRGLLYKKAHKIGVLLESVRAEFIEAYPRLDSGKVAVIPNPVGKPAPREADFGRIADRFGCPEAGIDVILAMGRLVPVKGFDSLVAAFARARSRNPRLRLAIAGDGPEGERLKACARANGAEDSVLFLGPTKTPAEALRQAAVFAITSRSEGFPMALAEAMLAGIPIVGYDASGVRDFVESERSGILVAQGDTEGLANALLRVVGDSDLRSRLTAEARRVMERYSPEAVDRIWFEEVLAP